MINSKTLRNRHFFVLDIAMACLTPILALTLRLDGVFHYPNYASGLITVTLLFLVVKIIVFYFLGLYRHYWHYAGIDELMQITVLVLAATILQTILFKSFSYFPGAHIDSLPRSIPIIDGMLTLIFVGISRFSIRLSDRLIQKVSKYHRQERVLIVGAGNAGIGLVKRMRSDPQRNPQPIAFIDDNPAKIHQKIHGLKVMGNHYDIPKVIESLKIGRVIIAMPSLSGKIIQEIFDICQSTRVKTSILPRLDEIINSPTKDRSFREINIKDLLRREPIQTDIAKVSRFILGKRVLITGAGGSIGSEICRQVLNCYPAEIILLGHGENSIFNIEQELRQTVKILQQDGKIQGPPPRLMTLIADIRFASRLEGAFARYQPDIIFHAAAHKHVPLMEVNTSEAITNNVRGTKNLVDLAVKYDVKNFVMISTDKAVNPTNIMGTSKRVAEMVVLQAAQKTGKAFGVVRFGNVLGSRGSVVPTFKKQIAAGGPITVTHPDICRYFITIPEAVQLTMQASVLSRSGEIIMLNMGKSVKIVDLAKDLIRLSGYEPGKDIEIKFTGLRPGEKLFEELFTEGEDYEPIESDQFFICKNASHSINPDLDRLIPTLCQAAAEHQTQAVVTLLQQLVPEYQLKHPDDIAVQTLKAGQQHQQISFQSVPALPPEYQEANQFAEEGLSREILHQAFENKQLRIYYQPIVCLANQQTVSFEALLRWQHPQQFLIPAKELISVLEQSNLIFPIGDWMLSRVCRHIQTLQQNSPTAQPISISMNLSAKQLLQPYFADRVKRIFLKTGVSDPSNLIFEIPYHFLQEHADSAIGLIPQLKALGVQLHLDRVNQNFVTLKQHSQLIDRYFNGLKINLSYLLSPENQLNFIQFSHENHCQIIATEIELHHQLEQVKQIDCQYSQGYFLGDPKEDKFYLSKLGRALQSY